MLGTLRRATDFDRVRREGTRWRGRYCTLSVARAPQADTPTRAGYVVSRAVGKAVKRNRARRLLREAMRRLADRLLPGWDIVLIAQPPIADPKTRMAHVYDELIWLLDKARLIQAPTTEK
ncbi:MAG: ribonuclease P protein component [Chloroflexi bacterium]|jgi:ribonuclease P protein component|nr:ribonuclease P protein component [Chloroflexota bacterium]